MTERGKHLEEALRGLADEGVPQTGDPWPAVRKRVAGKPQASSRPSRRSGLPRGRRLVLASVAILALLFGSAAYAASSFLTGEETDLKIEQAALQSGPNGDRIVVQLKVSGEANNPSCSLLQGVARPGLSRTESPWLDDDLTELWVLGDKSIYTYFEDRNVSDGSVDTSRTPLYAFCDAGTGTGPGRRVDEAHVAGTAAPGTEQEQQGPEFVRKDMSSPAIRPLAATLSHGGASVEGSLGPYCWIPGPRDKEKNVLWCWNKAEDKAGVPDASETIRVPAGATMDLRFEGEPNLDSLAALPQRLSGGNPTGSVPGSKPHGTLRVERVGDRLEIPITLDAGEYLVSVDARGPDGEASYYFRVAVTGE